MAKKRKTTKKHGCDLFAEEVNPSEHKAAAVGIAQTVLRPTVQAAVTVTDYNKSFGELDLSEMVKSLAEQAGSVLDQDLQRGEAMLAAQAHTLDSIFNNLARRAIKSEYINHLDRYLKLALRAQSQCRATWEALATMQNPPIMGYVRQANIAHGPQQVNNAPHVTDKPTHARENENRKNKLLEEKGEELLDARATGATGRDDPAMAAMGECDRTEDSGR